LKTQKGRGRFREHDTQDGGQVSDDITGMDVSECIERWPDYSTRYLLGSMGESMFSQ